MRSSGRSAPVVRSVLLVVASAVLALGPACGKSGSTAKDDPGKFGTKPKVSVPSKAPTALEKTDLIVGTGAEAVAGKKISVQYVGVSQKTKKQFDASWDRGETFSFRLGAGQVIGGWDQGVAGMKVGGRRRIVIPPELGYGSRGAGGVIKPHETLVFVVDLIGLS